ncbi:hypothetical protein Glove_501g16 [Diversispora epigaea]|uniref:Serine-threonine/tyrosine-protein kinase catalytic domain-containing protein n=1 Tax=Diversispora epigaea TaxID=1348612 RepID=A0A397GMR0_9GLOM|nr:hypothetical protein Glove_501g16 [Diversispora epigaea]
MIMRCWDARITHRPTFKGLYEELYNNEITIPMREAEELSANHSTTTTSLNFKTHPQAIYTKLEELTESFSHIITIYHYVAMKNRCKGSTSLFIFESKSPIEVPLAGYIQAKSLPYIGSWIQFSLAIISNLCNNSIEQPQPMVSTRTQEFQNGQCLSLIRMVYTML